MSNPTPMSNPIPASLSTSIKMSASFIVPIALIVIVLCAFFIAACYVYSRRDRLKRAYRHIGKTRRQSRLDSNMFTHDPERYLLRSFLHGYLHVPESVLGFNSQSQLSDGDLSRLATLWAALGPDANLCYGFIDEKKRHRFRPDVGGHASIWVEFPFDGELWVYWYEDDAAIVDRRRDFYRNGAATILHDLRFGEYGHHLFKT